MRDSRIIREWLDAKGNKINISKSSSPTTTSTDFTDKFKKLYGHIDSVWGGVNVLRCGAHELMIYYGYGQEWYHLIIRYVPTENCFEINLTRQKPDTLIYAGEAYSWSDLLDILEQTETIKNRKMCEWVDSKGNKISLGTSASQVTKNNNSNKEVYIWDMYIDPKDKGTWCSAEKYYGEYDGTVFSTRQEAFQSGLDHLRELDDEGELRGDIDDYDIDAVAIQMSEVSDYALKFSGLK